MIDLISKERFTNTSTPYRKSCLHVFYKGEDSQVAAPKLNASFHLKILGFKCHSLSEDNHVQQSFQFDTGQNRNFTNRLFSCFWYDLRRKYLITEHNKCLQRTKNISFKKQQSIILVADVRKDYKRILKFVVASLQIIHHKAQVS